MLEDHLPFMWGYSSVVEHSTADQEVPSSNPGVSCFFEMKFTSLCKLCLARVPWTVRYAAMAGWIRH